MVRPGKKVDIPLLRPGLYTTGAMHCTGQFSEKHQGGGQCDGTDCQFPSQGRQPWAMQDRAAGPLLPSHLKHLQSLRPKVEIQFNVSGLID
jgi:hypothetical protein